MLALKCNNIKTKIGDFWGNKIIPKLCKENWLKKYPSSEKKICSAFEEGHSILQSIFINSVNSRVN